MCQKGNFEIPRYLVDASYSD